MPGAEHNNSLRSFQTGFIGDKVFELCVEPSESFVQPNAALTARSSVTSVANPADELPTFNTLWLARTKTEYIPTDRYSESSLSFRRASELALAR
jgi:hypothetical protein